MTCELALPRGIDPARLDGNRYLESLVEQGAAAGLFRRRTKNACKIRPWGCWPGRPGNIPAGTLPCPGKRRRNY